MKKSRVLVFDIETAPMLAYVWGLHDQNVGLNQLHSDWHVLAWAAKWHGDSDIMYMDQRHSKDISDDKVILEKLWKLLDEADIVITQNGKNFDAKRLNARFIFHGMNPPSPYKHIDTYQIVKRVADFTSNKLEYLTDKLCTKYKKLSHSRFPGFTLWRECLAGNKEAWDEMEKYNKHDVFSTEEFFNKIKAWAPPTMPSIYQENNMKCPKCKQKGFLQKRGFAESKEGTYQRFQCLACKAWPRVKVEK